MSVDRHTDQGDLRSRAERRLHLTRQDVAAMSGADVQELVHELQVHQIELEMQNEALNQAQAETEAARQKYQDLYDFAPVGYLTVAQDGTVVDVNVMATRLLATDRDALVGQQFSNFVAPASRDVLYLHLRTVFRTHAPQDCQVITTAAEPLHLHVNSHAEVGGDHCRMAMSDITPMKRLEARLVQLAETAQAANIAKSQFLANMSHEIRTPLNAIVGLGSLLDGSLLDAKQNQWIATIRSSADVLLALVNDVLDVAKLEAGAMQMENRAFDLRQLLEDVQRMAAVAATAKGLTLALDYPADAPTVFSGDAFRLRQVVTNLVSNAVKFTPSGHVQIAVVSQALDDCSQEVFIRVIDTGIGIPEAKRPDIFESFTQADPSTTRQYGGSGLGLNIAKRLVGRMGGDIDVENNTAGGSIFVVRLPLKVDAFPAADDARAGFPVVEQVRVRRPRVLLVEDHPGNVLVAAAYLERFGCDFDVCASGVEAIHQYDKADYAMILMDVEMPEMDGFATARRIRELERQAGTVPTPIVAMTAHALPAYREQCLASGMNDYIAKPFDPVELQKHILALTRRD